MFSGYKTYTGIILLVVTAFGLQNVVFEGDLAQLIGGFVAVVGAVLGIYGRYVATRK